MKKISVYIPSYNSTISLNHELSFEQVIISDNGNSSITNMEKALNVEMIEQTKNLGRVGNWKFCIDHFANSNADWMKWCFAGDFLKEGSKEKISEALEKFPEAKMVICEYDILTNNNQVFPWESIDKTRIITPEESMLLAAQKGNWFGSPVGHVFSKDAFKNGYELGELDWVADMRLCLEVAKRYPVLYLKESVGTFNMNNRNYYLKQANSLFSLLEEGIIRKKAADYYLELTNDEIGYLGLIEMIERQLEEKAVIRRLQNSKTTNDIMHMLLPIKQALGN